MWVELKNQNSFFHGVCNPPTFNVNIIWIKFVWEGAYGIPKYTVVLKKNKYKKVNPKLRRWHDLKKIRGILVSTKSKSNQDKILINSLNAKSNNHVNFFLMPEHWSKWILCNDYFHFNIDIKKFKILHYHTYFLLVYRIINALTSVHIIGWITWTPETNVTITKPTIVDIHFCVFLSLISLKNLPKTIVKINNDI